MTNSDKAYSLDNIFEALGNEHRRYIVNSLGLQPCTISYLANKRELSLPAIHKHIKVLENADLIKRKKNGRITYLTLNRQALQCLHDWVMKYHPYWGSDKETHENYMDFLNKK